MANPSDKKFMQIALSLARRGVGLVAPNPAVGCVLVKDDEIIARGWTASGGRPHAETEALKRAGKAAKGATAYITLEPCCHHGKTPPCTEALIKAGIKKVVIATKDPDQRVCGKGIAALKAANIEVVAGILEEEAKRINEGFITLAEQKRPFIILKLANSLDGKIGTSKGSSKWITGEKARQYAHMLRCRNDAILIGSKTAATDDPSLICRLPGLEQFSPVRIVVDSDLKLSTASKLVKTAKTVPTWIITTKTDGHDDFTQAGVKIIVVKSDNQQVGLIDAMQKIGELGITRLLVEGGGSIAASFLLNHLVDKLMVISGGKIIGGEGISSIGNLGIEEMDASIKFTLESVQEIGGDVAHIYTVNKK